MSQMGWDLVFPRIPNSHAILPESTNFSASWVNAETGICSQRVLEKCSSQLYSCFLCYQISALICIGYTCISRRLTKSLDDCRFFTSYSQVNILVCSVNCL